MLNALFSSWNSLRSESRSTSAKPGDRVLCLEFLGCGVRVCEFQNEVSDWRLVQEFQFEWDPNSSDSAEARGEQLRHQLHARQVQATSTYISFPRNRVILKLLALPALDSSQFAEAIALQCEAKGLSPSEFVIDYAIHQSQESSTQNVTIAAIRRDIFDSIGTIVTNESKLQIAAMGLGEFGFANSHPSISSFPQLLLIAEETELQFVVTLAGMPLTFVSVPLTGDDQQLGTAITTTVTRITNSLAEKGIRADFQSFDVVGPLTARVLNDAGHNFQARPIDSDAGNHDAGNHTPTRCCVPSRCLGMLPDGQFRNRFDFLKPLPLVAKTSNPNKKWKRLAVRLALAGLFLMIVRQWYVDRLDHHADQLRQELANLSQQDLKYQMEIDTANELANWTDSKVAWSEQLIDVLAKLPGNDRIFLTQVHMEKTDVAPAQIRIEGAGRTLDDVLALNQKLLSDSEKFRLRPEQITRSDTDPHYEVNFTVSAEVIAEN